MEEYSEDETVEVDVTEISLTDIEIEEWMSKLVELKETKQPVTFELDDETELVINYDEDEDDD
jgi:hypothetical protein